MNILKISNSPKLVLIGGSNLAFGIDSEMIKKNLEIPVINMGLHANLGIEFTLNQVNPYIKKGDIIIVIPEYSNYFSKKAYGTDSLIWLLDLDHSMIQYCNFKNIYSLYYFSSYSINKIRRVFLNLFDKYEQTEIIYTRDSFNKNGDMIAHLNSNSTFNPKTNISIGDSQIEDNFNPKIINSFKVTAKLCDEKEAFFLVSYPPYPQSYFDKSKKLIYFLNNHLVNQTNSLNVISDPEDYSFKNENFFDSCYHLNNIGIQRRTKKLLNDISIFLNANLISN